jgi:Ca2+-binding RTX toxin-like protein
MRLPDPHSYGSGNPGATNVLRTGNKLAAVLTLIGDAPSLNGTGNTLANIIIGSSGDNTLDGAAGNDTLNGGLGNDTLTGGLGNDIFVFNTAPNATSNLDRITDFNVVSDTIQLENSIFTGLGLTTGVLNASMFVKGDGVIGAADSTDRIAYNTTTGALYYDADGVGGSASVQIALIGNQANLTVTDLVVI